MKSLPLYFCLLSCSALLIASCGGDNESASCSTIISRSGEPDMLGAPSFSANSVTAGDPVTVTIPVDDEATYINLNMMSSFLQPVINVEPVTMEAVTPIPGSSQNLQYVIDTTGYAPGLYFPAVDLCIEPNSCFPTTMTTGVGVGYSNTSFTDPAPNYMRQKFWDQVEVNGAFEDACIKIPFIQINSP